MKTIRLLIILFAVGFTGYAYAQEATSTSSASKYRILMDIAHGQRFWNDPKIMKDANQVGRVNYMTEQFQKTASSVDAAFAYLKEEIKLEHLRTSDILFIHIPSIKYSTTEVNAITKYLSEGGSLFLVMDADFWSTLEQTNVNDIIRPFNIQFGNNSPDTLSGGYTKSGVITPKPLKVTCHGARIVKGGTPFCFSNQSEENPFGTFISLKNGGKIIVMGDGMVSLYMTSWKDVNNYQCEEFMHDAFQWLLK